MKIPNLAFLKDQTTRFVALGFVGGALLVGSAVVGTDTAEPVGTLVSEAHAATAAQTMDLAAAPLDSGER